MGQLVTYRQMRTGERSIAPQLGRRILALFFILEVLMLLALSLIFAGGAQAQPVKGEISVTNAGGFGRIIFRFEQEVEAEVRASNNIVIIHFKRPVDVQADRISIGLSSYIGAARRDPDGNAIRLALARKVTVNSMAAGERLFVDLLPDTWSGMPPGLPQDIVDELARRAREAERRARQQQLLAQQKQSKPVRVRVGRQPTFTRYVFELPELVPVATDRTGERLTLVFDAPLRFDLAEAKAWLPPNVMSIDTEPSPDAVGVRFNFVGKVDVRTFREDNNYVVDVVTPDASGRGEGPQSALPTPPPSNADPPAASGDTNSGPSIAAAQAAAPVVIDPVPLPQPRPKNAPSMPQQEAAIPAMPPETLPSEVAVREVATLPAVAGAESRPEPDRPAPLPLDHSAQDAGPKRERAEAASRGHGEEQLLKARAPDAPVVAEVRQQGEALRVTFPFAVSTPAAVFRRYDTLWLVFDTPAAVDVTSVIEKSSRLVRAAEVTAIGESKIVRIKLDRPKLASLGPDGTAWVITLGDMVLEPTRALGLNRNTAAGRTIVTVPFDAPQKVHRISDPEIGDTIVVVTANGPARGFLKPQDFVEFRALASSHGVIIQPLSDELTVELSPDKLVLSHPAGLTLSPVASSSGEPIRKLSLNYRPALLDTQVWGFDRQAPFVTRQNELSRGAAEAPPQKRTKARLDLARFYLANDMWAEAKGVLDVTIGDDHISAEDPSALVLRAIANIKLRRPAKALDDLKNPVVGNQQDAPLWRALALMREGKWTEARAAFQLGEAAIATLPVELQRATLSEAVRAAIETRDFSEASRLLNEFDALGIPREMQPAMAVLKGRLDEGLGRISDALEHYRTAADSWDRPHASQGRLREITLRHALGDLKRPDAVAGLETLTAIWRGDETEIEGLQLLARLYTEEGRYRDAFHVMRTALRAHPGSEMTRRIQEEAAQTFDSLFLAGKGDAMPAIDALSLFYDFSELTPLGRRGDEMIRRLSDRLVAVDLLDQAAELLQHQIDHRLQGIGRAQVAVRLALIYLMNRKPDRALQALRTTRSADVTNELRNQRLLVEARALSDTGRHDLAIEVVANLQGREVDRLRADVLWGAKRWGAAAEQIEKFHGDRWREFAPLSEVERNDILRAAIGYALADDALGLDRFRQKYLAKMAETPDQRAFEILTTPVARAGQEFGEITKAASAINTLNGFMQEMRARYPDFGAVSNAPPSGSSTPRNSPQTPPRTVGG